MRWRYGSVFIYSSLQFSGNIEEYFSKHSRKCVVFLVLPRFNHPQNMVRVYREGKLEEEFLVKSSPNMILYYYFWYKNYFSLLLKYFKKREKVFVISFHPLSFFLSSLQKRFRNITYIYWSGDYFPGYKPTNVLFRIASKFYHKRIKNKLYLSDRLNKILNGQVMNSKNIKTVMWGVNKSLAYKMKRKNPTKNLILGFSGVIRESQGIEELLYAMKDLPNVTLKILGPAPAILSKKYKIFIKKHRLEKRIFFPNRAIYGEELKKMFNDCHVGIALYDVTDKSATFYADPAKIKTYAELGLPVIMTNAADVANYITRFHAGIVTGQTTEQLSSAIEKISTNYAFYRRGLEAFNEYFDYENYYKSKFKFLETL